MTIGDLAADDEGSIAIGPFGSSMKADTYTAAGIPVVRGNNLTGQPGFFGDFVFVPEELARRFPRCLLQPGDLVFPHRGAIGEVGLTVDQGYATWMLSTSMMKLRVHPDRVDPHFTFYHFRSQVGRHQLLRNASQVGTPGIGQPLASLRACEIALPPLAEQRAIVGVLRALDDKIEHNRRTRRALEGLARAMFKAWFVDFEPVHAKAAGATAFPGMPLEAFAALPTTLTDTPLGPVPEGWKPSQLGDMIDIHDFRRIPLSKKEREAKRGPFRYFGAAGVIDYVDEFLFDGVHVLTGEDGSVVNDDGTPVTQYVWGQFWVNNHAHVLTARWPWTNEHLLLLLKSLQVKPFVTGAVQPKLSQGNLKSIPIIIPKDNVLASFGRLLDPLYAALRSAHDESRKLAELRDYLLPKLLSGEVRVSSTGEVLSNG